MLHLGDGPDSRYEGALATLSAALSKRNTTAIVVSGALLFATIARADFFPYPTYLPSIGAFALGGAQSALSLDHGGLFSNPSTIGTFRRRDFTGSLSMLSSSHLSIRPESGEGPSYSLRTEGSSSSFGGVFGTEGKLKDAVGAEPLSLLSRFTFAFGYYLPNESEIDQTIRVGRIDRAGLREGQIDFKAQVRTVRGGGGFSLRLLPEFKLGHAIVFDRAKTSKLQTEVLSIEAREQGPGLVVDAVSVRRTQGEANLLTNIVGAQWFCFPWLATGASLSTKWALRGRSLEDSAVRSEVLHDGNGRPPRRTDSDDPTIHGTTREGGKVTEEKESKPRHLVRAGVASSFEAGLLAFEVNHRFRSKSDDDPGVTNVAGAVGFSAWDGGALRLGGFTQRSAHRKAEADTSHTQVVDRYAGVASISHRLAGIVANIGLQRTWMRGEAATFNIGSYRPKLIIRGSESVFFAGITSDLD